MTLFHSLYFLQPPFTLNRDEWHFHPLTTIFRALVLLSLSPCEYLEKTIILLLQRLTHTAFL